MNGLMEGEWFYFRDKESEKWKSLKGSYKSGDEVIWRKIQIFLRMEDMVFLPYMIKWGR